MIFDKFEALREESSRRLKATVKKMQSDRDQEKSSEAESDVDTPDPKMELLRKQQTIINRIATEPRARATVLAVKNAVDPEAKNFFGVVSHQGMQLEVVIPKDMAVRAGDEVSLLNSMLQPV